MKSFAVALALTGTLLMDSSWAETRLLLERKIPLGEVRGRIDDLAVDLKRAVCGRAPVGLPATAPISLWR